MIPLPLLAAVLLAAASTPAPTTLKTPRATLRRATPAPAAPTPAPAAPEVAEDPGRLLLEQKCGKCHDLSRARSSSLTDAGWKGHLRRMAKLPGAAITDEQARAIHAWLKANPVDESR